MQPKLENGQPDSIVRNRFRACVENLHRLIEERRDAKSLAPFRFQRLADLVRFASTETKLGHSRLAALFPNGLDLSRWTELRPVQKHEIMQSRSDAIARILPAEAGRPIEGWTAGTTGQPLHFMNTELAGLVDEVLNQRFFADWSLDPRGILVQIGIERGRARGDMRGSGWNLGSRQGKWIRVNVSEDPDAILDKLIALKPSVLKLYPLSLSVLTERARARNTQIPLDLVICGGNIVTADMRQDCKAIFRCEVADTYGAEEVGNIAIQCPRCGQLHVSEESVLLEVIKDDGDPAETGETGRAIVTSFYNFAMPLLRYDLEDYVQVGDNSLPCARGRLTLTQIRGRSTSAFRLADGRINWPFVPANAIFALGNVKHFQFVQVALDRVEFRYVPQRQLKAIEIAPVQDIVDRYIDASLRASVVPVNAIPREADMKYMLFKGLSEAAPRQSRRD